MAENAKWYVVHTYSGYENTVAASIMKAAENRQMQDLIQEVNIPLETVVEHTDGGDKEVERKVFPGYVLVEMIVNDRSWYAVRNTPGVTGFVGSGTKPIPLTDDEVRQIMHSMGMEEERPHIDFQLQQMVRLKTGPFAGQLARISDINE